jgi:uncharacterized surface protein with fasciclin (FAS1) repeats
MRFPRLATLAAAAAAVAALAACSSPSQQPSTATDVPPVPTVAAKGALTPPPVPGSAPVAIGPNCGDLPLSDDPGSIANMSLQPVAAAIESNPDLSTLSAAITRAGLTAQLNTAPGLTVFAPTNEAFDRQPDLRSALNDRARLTALLEYHVSGTRHTAAELRSAGTSTQLAEGTVRIGGPTTALTVTDGVGTVANVRCGDITTQNATMFIVDAVLIP